MSALKSKEMDRSRDFLLLAKGMVVIPSTCQDVSEMLSQEHAHEKSENNQCLLRILSNIRYLPRQGLAFRGDADEGNSNFFCSY